MRNMRNNIKRVFVAVLVAGGLAVSAALAAPSFQAKLTVQGYDGAELANFPVLVRLSPQTVDGFDYDTCLEGGSDVVFVDELGDPLDYQLDTWNPSGESLFWVRLPTLKQGVAFYVRWNDSEPNVDGVRSAATWNANYGAVWHMGEADGVCTNSTQYGRAYDATPKGATAESVRYDGTDAPVGGARTTSKGTKAYLSVPNYDALQFDGTFTISGWVRLEASSGCARLFSRKDDYNGSGWEVEAQNGSMKSFTARGNANSKNVSFTLPGDGLKQHWVHLAFVYNNNHLTVYGDGVSLAEGQIAPALDNGLKFSIGCDSDGSEAFAQGAFDECRLMKGAASADWVKAEYDTVKKADFLTYGERVDAVIDRSLGISAVTVAERGDSFVDLGAMLTGLGETATEASIQLAYGFDETSLVKTQIVLTATAPSRLTLRLARLLPQRVYCVRVVAVNDLDERAVSDPVRVMTAASQDTAGVAGVNQTFFTQANANWEKSYAELPQGTDWRNYQDGNRIYRRELGVLAAYLGGFPEATKRRSEVWGDEVYWPVNGGQWVYWGQMRLESGKSYCFRMHIDDNERVQVTDPSTGLTSELLNDVSDCGDPITSLPFVPTETGWHPIEIRLSDGTGLAGGRTTTDTDGYRNTKNMGWSDDGGVTWKLMMDPGDGSLLTAGDCMAIRVDEVIANGVLKRLTLTFPSTDKPRDLYVAWGAKHGGGTTNGWTHVEKLTKVDPGCGSYAYDLPDDWGEGDKRVIRFFLDGTLRLCSSSVYWRDCSEPWLTGLSLDGRGGDTLKVTGNLASFAGSSCTLKVLVGQTPEALVQAWTGLAGSVRQAPGPFALTLFADSTSPEYLSPGATYYVCVEATAGGFVSRSQVMQVTMAGDPAFGSVSATVSGRTVTFRGQLTDAGMGDVATVSLWIGDTNDETKFKQVGDPLDERGGEFSFTHTFPEFERTYYWQFRAVSTSGGGATAETRTKVDSYTTADTATYTWQGGANGDWENSDNWGNSGGDVFGYPNGPQTVVNFSVGTKARIVLRGEMSVGILNLNQPGLEITFARGDGLEAKNVQLSVSSSLPMSGTRLRLTLDGVALSSPSTSLSAFDCEVRLSNGANWYLSGPLSHTNGGRLWLGPNTSLSCADFVFGGSQTVIDDATLEVRSCVVLGEAVPGGTIRFVGTQPAFRCSSAGAMVRSNLETANVRLEFALPVGGYQEPPFVNTSTRQDYILGYNGTQKRLWPITVDVARGSSGAFVQGATETTLISWGKGICPEIIQTAAKPGANATFVWSDETVGNDAYPVSLGVRLAASAGFMIQVR